MTAKPPAKRGGSALARLKAGGKQVARPGEALVAAASKAREAATTRRILIIFDATKSREASLRGLATHHQAGMMGALAELGNIEVGIGYHSGGEPDFLGWFSDADATVHAMKGITCVPGQTNFTGVLDLIGEPRPDVIVLVGDTVESHHDHALTSAAQSQGVPVFALQDMGGSGDLETGKLRFQAVAEATGGIYNTLNNYSAVITAIGALLTGQVQTLRGVARVAADRMLAEQPGLRRLAPPSGGSGLTRKGGP